MPLSAHFCVVITMFVLLPLSENKILRLFCCWDCHVQPLLKSVSLGEGPYKEIPSGASGTLVYSFPPPALTGLESNYSYNDKSSLIGSDYNLVHVYHFPTYRLFNEASYSLGKIRLSSVYERFAVFFIFLFCYWNMPHSVSFYSQ